MALAAHLVLPVAAWPLVLVALLVTASRAFIAAHYLGDVIAGTCTGLFGVSVIYAIWHRYLPTRPVGAAPAWGRTAPAND